MSTNLSTRTKTDKVYRLDWDITHLGECDEDAWLSNYPNYSGVNNLALNYPSGLPHRFEFESIGSMLNLTDYPYTDVTWPIMSKRMLDVLLSVGSFPHEIYPVVMLDVELAYDKNLKKHIAPRTENHNYVAIHLTEYLDAFDFENSIYKRDADRPELILRTSIKWLALREPKAGFPPLFAVKPADTKLFVSAEARLALETANIQGIDFLYVEDGTSK